jgi:FlaA1/EpsC-like NDP-sugar epimerase
MRNKFLNLPRKLKQIIVLSLDIVFALFSTYLAFMLRSDSFDIPGDHGWVAYAISIIFIPVFIRFGLYRAIFRYSGVTTLFQVNKAVLAYAALYLTGILIFSQNENLPLAIGFLQPGIFMTCVILSRTMARLWLYNFASQNLKKSNERNLLIYGAGSAGVQIGRVFSHSREFHLACYIDDDPSLGWKQINGINIFPSSLIDQKIQKHQITDVLIAIPSLSQNQRIKIIKQLSHHSVYVRTLPNIINLTNGKISVEDIKELDLDDLLGRESVPIDYTNASTSIEGKVVLITGAGGSIGSELARQILVLSPAKLILIDHSEFALYQIIEELKKRTSIHVEVAQVIGLLGDVHDYSRMSRYVKDHEPDFIYHAAAYKHVPIVEDNPIEGVLNNVFGTFTMAQVAIEYQVKSFVLIRTDKAVRPTNVMGASKRIAELCLQSLAKESAIQFDVKSPLIENKTIFTMVRFGNVLGSSGSVIPLFRRQIMNGGPVTLTDARVTRYFMSIPEASQLVIQAGFMSKGGEVFVLDMGEPVKIFDLAKRLIQLMGKSLRDESNPNGEIEIQEIGLRPGEKLYEELLIGNQPIQTEHPKIMAARESMIPWSELSSHLNEMQVAINNNDLNKIKSMFLLLVEGYMPHTNGH